ncbi:6643_t:CDS:1, partial [Racocetra persica]
EIVEISFMGMKKELFIQEKMTLEKHYFHRTPVYVFSLFKDYCTNLPWFHTQSRNQARNNCEQAKLESSIHPFIYTQAHNKPHNDCDGPTQRL